MSTPLVSQGEAPQDRTRTRWYHDKMLKGSDGVCYRLIDAIGDGGFATVYLAVSEKPGDARYVSRPFAIKEYAPALWIEGMRDNGTHVVPKRSHGEEFDKYLSSFREEAKRASKFDHPNVVRAVDHFPANGTYYLAMEYEAGESLADMLKRRRGGMRRIDAMSLIFQLLTALEYVHEPDKASGKSLLHRDIKPSNIWITRRGGLILMDFGNARPQGTSTKTASPPYAAPELEKELEDGLPTLEDPATDMYSVGAVLYRLAFGAEPTRSTLRDAHDVARRGMALRELGYSHGDIWTLNRAMALDSDQRPQNVAEFRRALRWGSAYWTLRTIADHWRAGLWLAAGIFVLAAALWVVVRLGTPRGAPDTSGTSAGAVSAPSTDSRLPGPVDADDRTGSGTPSPASRSAGNTATRSGMDDVPGDSTPVRTQAATDAGTVTSDHPVTASEPADEAAAKTAEQPAGADVAVQVPVEVPAATEETAASIDDATVQRVEEPPAAREANAEAPDESARTEVGTTEPSSAGAEATTDAPPVDAPLPPNAIGEEGPHDVGPPELLKGPLPGAAERSTRLDPAAGAVGATDQAEPARAGDEERP